MVVAALTPGSPPLTIEPFLIRARTASAPSMALPIPIALLGFSSFERNALASYFRVAAQRVPAYSHVLDVDQARFVIADADQPGVPELLSALGRTADAVFVGAHSPDGSAGWMMRPIDSSQVLRELDNLVALRDEPASGPASLAGSGAAPAVFARGASPSSPMPLDMPARRAHDDPHAGAIANGRRAAAEQRRLVREAGLRPRPLRRALLVDDSELALHFLDRHLHSYGLATEWAMNSGKALELMVRQSFGFMFIDIDLGEFSDLDGLALCQHIKHRHVFGTQPRPVVALVSAFHDPVDRVRGTLAGADAHLGKPLDLNALDVFLRSHGLWRMSAVSAERSAEAGAERPALPGDLPAA